MKPMLNPGVIAEIRCVRDTLQQWIAPALEGRSELSYVTTAGHLLAHVENRIAHEGQMLFDELARLRGDLLSQALKWLDQRGDARPLRDAIAASLAQERDASVYPTLAIVADEVAALRQHVCDVLELLHAAPENAGAKNLHQAIRDYIGWQLEEEGKITEPSFRGGGPRR